LFFFLGKGVDVGFNVIEFVGCFANNDTPPNSLKDLDASLKVKTLEKEGVGVCFLACNILGVRPTCWNFRMGIKTNSQMRIQDEINLHN
jgi:hypothetical protein